MDDCRCVRECDIIFFLLGLTITSAVGVSFGQGDKKSFSITIDTPDKVVKVGSDVRLEITMTNISDQAIPVGISRPEYVYGIVVRHDGDKLAPETRYGRRIHGKENPPIATSVVADTLQPGDKLEEHLVLNEIYDLSEPGTYIVEVTRNDRLTKGMVKSNKLTFTVNP